MNQDDSEHSSRGTDVTSETKPLHHESEHNSTDESSSSTISRHFRSRRHVTLILDGGGATFDECACLKCTGKLLALQQITFDCSSHSDIDGSDSDDTWERCVAEEEEFEATISTKAKRVIRKSRRCRTRPSDDAAIRRVKARDRARVRRRLELASTAGKLMLLAEERAVLTRERKVNKQERCEQRAKERDTKERRTAPSGSGVGEEHMDSVYDYNYESANEYGVLPAKELGIEEGDAYERLLEILEGDEITPEDFDLLLQLDERNERSTLKPSQISELELLVLVADDIKASNGKGTNDGGEGHQSGYQSGRTSISWNELGDDGACCLICLQPYRTLEVGAELRRLPCNHIYCRKCIDRWLGDNSVRCPDLSCYWASSLPA